MPSNSSKQPLQVSELPPGLTLDQLQNLLNDRIQEMNLALAQLARGGVSVASTSGGGAGTGSSSAGPPGPAGPAGATGATGASGGSAVAPTDPTILSVSVIDITSSSDGRPQKRVTVLYSPPGTLGTFTGVDVYYDDPDSSGTLAIADGSQVADGAVPALGTFSPAFIKTVPYVVASPSFYFDVDAPATPEYARVYLVPSANNTKLPVVQYGQAGASPSYQFLLTPPATPYQGREFAPPVTDGALSSTPTGWDANPHIVTADSGDQYFEFRVTWKWPTFDQNFQKVGGCNIYLNDGISQKVIGQVWMPASVVAGTTSTEADALFASGHITVLPGVKAYKVLLVAFNKQGQVNTYVDGITAEVDFNITRNTGTAGVEYAPLVTSDGVHAFVTVAPVAGADGTALLLVTGYFTKPAIPFGSVQLVVDQGDGVKRTIGGSTLSPIAVQISQPATVQTWTFYLRSVDINGNQNTITGSTPSVTLSVGNIAGQLQLGKAAPSSFSTEFQIVGGQLQLGNVSATSIVTGIFQVGGGGGKTSQMKVFDSVGAIIGFFGDDTLGTGYVGLWAKQARIGGTSPSTAPLQADTSGNVTLTNATIVSTSGTKTTTLDSGSLISTDTGSVISGLQGGLLSGQLFAQGTYTGILSQMSCSLWSLQFIVGGLQKVEIGAFLNGGAPYIKMNGSIGYTGTLAGAAGRNVIGGVIV